MTRLGFGVHLDCYILSHATKLAALPVNSIIRNGCDTDDPLTKGVYFLKSAGDEFYPYDPKTGSTRKDVDAVSSSQVFLPVQQVSAQKLMEFREDIKLMAGIVQEARDVFEAALPGLNYQKVVLGTCTHYDYDVDYDDDYELCDSGCTTARSPFPSDAVAEAWLNAVKRVITHTREKVLNERVEAIAKKTPYDRAMEQINLVHL